MKQNANNHIYKEEDFTNKITKNTRVENTTLRDMVMSMITMKYTQSNSVGYAYNGQMIGIGAGQQSRIDCTILARRKAEVWLLRHHPLVYNFADNLSSKMKVLSLELLFFECFTPERLIIFSKLFKVIDEPKKILSSFSISLISGIFLLLLKF